MRHYLNESCCAFTFIRTGRMFSTTDVLSPKKEEWIQSSRKNLLISDDVIVCFTVNPAHSCSHTQPLSNKLTVMLRRWDRELLYLWNVTSLKCFSYNLYPITWVSGTTTEYMDNSLVFAHAFILLTNIICYRYIYSNN